MTTKQNASSTVKATKNSVVVYLSARDEAQGIDSILDLDGWKIEAL